MWQKCLSVVLRTGDDAGVMAFPACRPWTCRAGEVFATAARWPGGYDVESSPERRAAPTSSVRSCRRPARRMRGRDRHADRGRRTGARRAEEDDALIGWMRGGREALAPRRLGLHRRLPARRGRPARRPARHHALGLVRRARRALPGGRRWSRSRSSCATATSYTSAGVTAGMDLALALVEEDLGREVALEVARWLVLFLRRPGGQAQFSAQLAGADRRARAAARAAGLDRREPRRRPLGAGAGASAPRMSPRNFARAFRARGRHDAGRVRRGGARRARPASRSSRRDRRSRRSPAGRASAPSRPCAARSAAASASARPTTAAASARTRMTQEAGRMKIAIPLYDRFTALDAVGPYEVLSRLPGASVHFAGRRAGRRTHRQRRCSA